MFSRAALACISFLATASWWSAESVRANELRVVQSYGTRAVEPCGRFAEDPAAVAPPGPCPRFGGRVRVDLGARAASPAASGYGAAPAAVRDDDLGERPPGTLDGPGGFGSGITRSHLRIQGPDAPGRIDPAAAR